MTTPYSFAHDSFAADLQRDHAAVPDGGETGVVAAVAGRIMLLRAQGKLAFASLRDSTGEIQLFALAAVTNDFESFARLHLGEAPVGAE